MRNYQRQRVYDWENKILPGYDKSLVVFDDIQTIVNYVWEDQGLKYPPIIEPLFKGNKKAWARGCRETLYFFVEDRYPTWVILHEMTHALTNDLHGPDFVGIYMRLLTKYLKVPLPVLTYTAQNANVNYNITSKPYFID